jgi:hypothetical protein
VNDDLIRQVESLRRELEDLKTQVVQPAAVAARVRRTSAQSIPNNTTTAISFSSARYDTATFWAAGNPTRLTIPEDGLYAVTYTLRFATSSVGYCRAQVIVNAATAIATMTIPPNATLDTDLVGATQFQLSAGDYIELYVRQASGGSLDIAAVASFSPEFSIAKIG